jgi:hypothetical protein
MALIDDVIVDALQGIDLARKGLTVIGAFDPPAAGVAEVGLTLLYEALVAVRSMLGHSTDEDIRAAIIAKMQTAMQELAAAKFGAMPPEVTP